MIDMARLEVLEAAAAAAPVDGGTVMGEPDKALVIPMRNALPALLRFARAMHDYATAMAKFSLEQEQRTWRGEIIPLDWSLQQCQLVQEKLDAAMAIHKECFDYGHLPVPQK